MLRQWQLDDVAGAPRVGVQALDGFGDLGRGRVRGQLDPERFDPDLGAVAMLPGDVELATGVVPNQDGAQPGHDPALSKRRHPHRQLFLDLGGHLLAVHPLRSHCSPLCPELSGRSAWYR